MGSCRITRSRNAPEWTAEETMVLVGNVAAVEEDYGADFSSHQKWEIVSSNTSSFASSASNYHRSAPLCRRKWDDLLTQYTSIRDTCRGYDSWSLLDPKSKEDLGAPLSFDRHLYALIDDILKANDKHGKKKQQQQQQNHHHSSSSPSSSSDPSHHIIYDLGVGNQPKKEEEKAAEDPDVQPDFGMRRLGPEKVKQIKREDEDTWKGVAEVKSRLQKIVGQIEAVHRGELSEDVEERGKKFTSTKLDAETNFKRRKANQLIRMHAILLANIQQLNKLHERGIQT